MPDLFVRLTYVATINGRRQTLTDGVIADSDGSLRIQFNKDVDWSQPVFIILEPELDNIIVKGGE